MISRRKQVCSSTKHQLSTDSKWDLPDTLAAASAYVETSSRDNLNMNKDSIIQLTSTQDTSSGHCKIHRFMNCIDPPIHHVSDEYLFGHVLPPLRRDLDIGRVCNGLKRRHTTVI